MAGQSDGLSYERELQMLAEQARNRSLVLFVGAGVSKDAGLPLWSQLLEPLRVSLGLEKGSDALDIAQWYSVANGRSSLLDYVRAELKKVKGPGQAHQLLACLPVPVIFTTNYDQLMEKTLEETQGVLPDVIVEDAHVFHEVMPRLNLDHLAYRPTDASEFVYVATRRAEQLRKGGHPREARRLLREARYVLQPVLGIRPNGQMNLFDREIELLRQQGTKDRPYQRFENRDEVSTPEAYAYNFLGKCYRLACAVALDLGSIGASQHSEKAEQNLRTASERDPFLPFPYAHRLHMYSDLRLPRDRRNEILGHLQEDLTHIKGSPRGKVVVARLKKEFPDARLE